MELAGVARVAVAAATYSIDKPYDYLVPAALADRVKVGVRVTVPFGKGNRVSEGVILALSRESKRPELKAIGRVLDSESVLGPEQIKLALWLRERYFCTIYDAVKVLLPAGLWYRVREVCTLAISREDALTAGANEKESRVLEALCAHGGSCELETLRLACGEGAAAVARELRRRGVLTIDAEADRRLTDKQARRVTLTVSAEEAMDAVERKRRSAPMRYEVIRLLSTVGSALSSDICYFTGASAQTLRNLEKSGLVTFSREEVFRPRRRRAHRAQRRAAGRLRRHPGQSRGGRGVLRPAVRRHRQREDPGLYPPPPGDGPPGQAGDDPGPRDRPDPPDDGKIQRLLRG